MSGNDSISPSKPKILFVINSLTGGGAERVMSLLLARTSSGRIPGEIHLVLLDREQQAYPVPPWLIVHQLDAKGSLINAVLQVSGVFRKIRPSVALSFLSRSNVACVIAGKLTGVPCIISERVDTSAHFATSIGGRIKRWIIQISYRHAAKIIAVSAGVAESLHVNFGISNEKIETIFNPIDVHDNQRKAMMPCDFVAERPYIAAIGRLVINKNFSLLLHAFAKANLACDLVILGEGPERNNLAGLARELGIEDKVRFEGFVENPFAILKGALFYVSASNAEGFPNSLLEAMSVGLPVISTNCPSGPSEVLAGQPRHALTGPLMATSGILVPQNDVESLSLALTTLSDSGKRAFYSEAALKRAYDFLPEHSVDKYLALLKAYLPSQIEAES